MHSAELRRSLERAGFTESALERACDSKANTRDTVKQLLPGLSVGALKDLTEELWRSVDLQRGIIQRKRRMRVEQQLEAKASTLGRAEWREMDSAARFSCGELVPVVGLSLI